ncbi:MAG: hypothetical protein ACRD1T_17860 [Acidimicrobiia bacterium]
MSYTFLVFSLSVGLFVVMLILVEVGRRIGVRRIAQDPTGAQAGVGTIEGAVLAWGSSSPSQSRERARALTRDEI